MFSFFKKKFDIKKMADSENGVFVLFGDLDDNQAYQIIKDMLDFSKKYPDKIITLYINSKGGLVTAGMAIYDVMRAIPNPISTIASEHAYGISALILSAGTHGLRAAYPNTIISLGDFYLNSTSKSVPDEIYTVSEKVIALIARHTGNTIEKIVSLLPTDTEMTIEAAIHFGIIDKTI